VILKGKNPRTLNQRGILEMPYKPKVCIVLVNWNQREDIINCLESLFNLKYNNYQIVVFDNGSVDNSVEEIKKKYPSVEIFENRINLGYVGANNIAINWAIEEGYDYIFLVNSDTVIHPYTLNELVTYMDKDKKCGVAGPQIRYYNAPDRLCFAGGKFNLRTGRGCHIGEGNLVGFIDSSPYACDFITGCAMLLRVSALKEIGLFDENIFMYCEDIDLCLRFKKSSWKVILVPNGIVWHKIERWDRRIIASPHRIYYIGRNTLYLMKKNNISNILIFLKATRHILSSVRMLMRYDSTRIVIFYLYGVIDFLRGKYGFMYSNV